MPSHRPGLALAAIRRCQSTSAKDQRTAFRKAVAVEDLLLIQGPPGTGKTRTISQIAWANAGTGQRVLVTSHTNRAVDNVLERLPGDLLAIRVGNDGKVTSAGEPYLLERQVGELRKQVANGVSRALTVYDSLEHAERWAGELDKLGSVLGEESRMQTALRAARQAVGGPAQARVEALTGRRDHLEDAAFVQGHTPTRILAVLFPVYSVEAEATVTEGEPYAVIDKYLERGIAEARFTTANELASFLALDPVVVARAIRFLTAIGHVVERGSRLEVTELGRRSLREDTRYTVTVRDRRNLYFDAFTSRPLTRPYYDSRTVTLLDDASASAVRASRRGPRFHTLVSLRGFDPKALAQLAANPHRDRFNLPERIDEPRAAAAPQTAFLPLYVVRSLRRDGSPCCLAYSQASDTADDDLAPIIESSPAPELLQNELENGRMGHDQKRVREWLDKRGLERFKPDPTRHGTWEVTLPPESFDGDRRVPLTKVGSYIVLGSGFLRLWCQSEKVRQRALLERINSYLAYRAQPARADIQDQVDRIARQLDLGTITLAALSHTARDAGNRGLATQLARLVQSNAGNS